MYGESNWSNNDRKRRGLTAIRIKEYMRRVVVKGIEG